MLRKIVEVLGSIPVCTWSPICSSDIVTDFPFSRLVFAWDGKQEGGGGGGGGGGVVVVT